MGRQTVVDLGKILALALIYFFTGKFGLHFSFLNQNASVIWPPTGIALAAVLLFGYRVWPGICLGAFFVSMTTTRSPLTSVCVAGGDTLQILLGARLVQQFANGERTFERARDIIRFILWGAILSAMVSAGVGVTSLAWGGFVPWDNYSAIWGTWWLGRTASALTITPMILIWSTTSFHRWDYRRIPEATLLLCIVVAISLIGFSGPLTASVNRYPRFLLYPTVLWAAYRFGQQGAITAAITVSAIAIWGTLHGLGPFASTDANTAFLTLLTYISTLTVTNLILGAAISERKRAEAELEAWQGQLESRVKERTRELGAAHKQLQAQIEERERLETEIAAAIEREQLRLGQELHDGLGQQLAGISYMMNALQIKLRGVLAPAAQDAQRLEKLILESVERVRRLAKGFYPVELERHGLLFALEEISRTTEQIFGVRCILESVESYDVDHKNASAIQLFRIAQEAIHNAIKHGEASQITVHLAMVDGHGILSVADNGIGLSSAPPNKSKGMGLQIMQYRAHMIGATVDVHDRLDGGVTVTCSFPAVERPASSNPQSSDAKQPRPSLRY